MKLRTILVSQHLVFLLFFIVIFGILFFIFKQRGEDATNQSTSKSSAIESTQPQLTPIPFTELTIPFLRQQSYGGQLGELKLLTKTTNYTSYLTNYNSDSLQVNGLLTIPNGEEPERGWPAVVFIHGYIPPDSYRTTEKYEAYVDYLARNGMVVFKIDLRGHGKSEGEANGAYYSSDYVVDTLNAYAALATADFVNPNKIGLWGHSMAGNVVLRTLAVKPTIPAAVIWAGAVYSYTDWEKYGLSDHSYQLTQQKRSDREAKRKILFDTHGQFSPDSPFWSQVAATNYLSDIQGAIQLHHAVDDTVVNIAYSRDLNSLLDSTSIPHELFEYNSGGHNISGSSFNSTMQRTVEFFQTKM
ncbi:MAG TPA: alpha/beta fold hydrolase [Candidatus Woesebacteria bacterium]|nr:alpha/beta fold hydrolase [Candidatus Woesebacteria bacterium]